jgi:hypothetical protein
MNKITKTIAGVIATFAFVAVFAASANAAYTRSLTVGSTGADVTELQTWLNSKGYLAVAPTGYFGNLTKAAVAAFQTANEITPAAGYFGPISQAKVASMGSTGGSTSTVAGCTAGALFSATTGAPCTGGSSSSTTLAGTDGSISDVNELSQYSAEEVGEGEEDVKVLGFEVEASNDGDIMIKSAKVSVTITNGSGSDNLDDYVDTVKVWMGSKQIGSADSADFSEGSSGVWSKTITLSSSVVKSDDTEKFYVTVDGAGSFDSGDIDSETATVALVNLRYEDGSGVVSTDDSTGDLTGGVSTTANFVSFSAAADTELKFSTDSSSPDAQVVLVDQTSTTDDVVLTKGKIKVDGTSDVLLDELPVTLTVTGATDVDMVTGSVKLTIDGEEYTETVSTATVTSATVTFDNLDITLEAGKTYTFTISADIEDTDGDLDEGDTITASVTGTNVDYVDAENEEGDQLVDDTEKTGTVNGDAQEFRVEGVQVALVSTSASSNNNDAADTGTFVIKYKVKAFGDTIYVASLATNAITKSVYDSNGTATTSNTITASLKNETDTSKTSVGNYEIEDGEEETFTLTITVPNGAGDASDQYYAALTGVKWDTSDDTSPANTYSSNLDDFQTSTVFLDNN